MADQAKALEHRVLKRLKMRISAGETWVLAVSGGPDSIVLVELILKWQKLLKAKFIVAHVHHNRAANPLQRIFRDKAQKFVHDYCAQKNLPFLTNRPSEEELNAETECREFRQTLLENWRQEHGARGILFAHHRDDLLETRLLRLIRGTGAAGIAAMKVKQGKKLRPLLDLSRIEIETYARLRGISYLIDPSNEDTGTLRNWLRKDWIPALENRQKGAVKSLARSLEILSRHSRPAANKSNVGLRRNFLDEKQVADYLRQLGVKNYGRSHVQEILKRIDTRQKNLTFTMLGLVFKVTPDLLMASRV